MADLVTAGAGGSAPAVGAVVLGGDYQGLGIARSLGRRRVPVVVVDDERSIGRHSRYVQRSVRVPDLRLDEGILQALLELTGSGMFGGWVVYPTRDEMVAALSHHRNQLSVQFRIPTPEWAVTKWAWDKRNTYQRAQDLGIPTPQTWRVRTEDELGMIDREPPYVLKPAIKERFFYVTGRKAWRADTREELLARYRAAAAIVGGGEMLIQELIPGGGDRQLAYCAFFKDGLARATMVARRLRQHPVEFGRASTFVCTTDMPEVEEMSATFLRSIGYYGLVEMEYKVDPRDGQAKLLDVNARTWGYHSLGQRAGVDFPYLLYADQVGQPVPDVLRAAVGLSWIRLSTDIPMAAIELGRRRLDWRSYLSSFRSVNAESVFAQDDLRPGLAELALLPYLAVKRGI